MKIFLGIIIGVILGLLVLGIGLFFEITSLAHSLNDHSTNTQPTSSLLTTSPTPIYPTTLPYDLPSKPVTSPTLPPVPAPVSSPAGLPSPAINPPQNSVIFDLNFPYFNISGPTSATINVQIANTGSSDAHNVFGKVEIYYQGSVIKIGGQDYLRTDVGTIKAGTNVTTQVILKVSLPDGLKVLANGATLKLTIFSDEKTQTYSYDFKP